MTIGFPVTENQNAASDQRESKKGANVRKIREGSNVQKTRGDSHDQTGDPGREIRSLIARMNAPKNSREKAVSRHGEPDTRLANLKDKQRRDHARERANQDDQPNAGNVQAFQRVDDWRRIINQRIPANQTGEHHDDRNIENRANNQRRDDADRQIALRAIAFLRGRGYGVETNVSEKHDGAAGQNSGPAVGRERVPVGGLNKSRGEANEHENRDDFEQHHHVVRFRGLANPANQKNRKKHDDDECGPVKAEMPAGGVEHVAFEVGKSAG